MRKYIINESNLIVGNIYKTKHYKKWLVYLGRFRTYNELTGLANFFVFVKDGTRTVVMYKKVRNLFYAEDGKAGPQEIFMEDIKTNFTEILEDVKIERIDFHQEQPYPKSWKDIVYGKVMDWDKPKLRHRILVKKNDNEMTIVPMKFWLHSSQLKKEELPRSVTFHIEYNDGGKIYLNPDNVLWHDRMWYNTLKDEETIEILKKNDPLTSMYISKDSKIDVVFSNGIKISVKVPGDWDSNIVRSMIKKTI